MERSADQEAIASLTQSLETITLSNNVNTVNEKAPENTKPKSKSRFEARPTAFLTLPRELRHKILIITFRNLDYKNVFEKNLWATWGMVKLTTVLRRVDERIVEDVNFTHGKESKA